MAEFEYSYICDDEEQYDSNTFQEGVPVDARYKHAANAYDAGNPYIEALPAPRLGLAVRRAYTKTVPFANPSDANMSDAQILSQIALLRQVRFPLPFHEELEAECNAVLITSYRNRHTLRNADVDLTYTNNDVSRTGHQIVVGNSNDATNAGFALLGYSGCGKSSSLKILFSNYPQVIRHNLPDGTHFIQIVYLVVNAVPNSNFKALYEAIGKAIDRALGNLTPVYEHEIRKASGLAGKQALVCRFIEQFAIGIIVFDEIQLIDFESTRENSFEGLMTMANNTKVAIAVVGTEDAYQHMFTKTRTARRIGSIIRGNAYCEDRRYFTALAANLFRYQWTKEPIKLTEGMVDTLYKYTDGIVDMLIGIYMYMGIDHLLYGKGKSVDSEFIAATAKKHYPGLIELLADIDNPLNESKRAELAIAANAEMRKVIDDARQKQFTNDLINGMQEDMDQARKVDAVVRNITAVTDDYNESTVRKIAESALKAKKYQGLDASGLTKAVMKKLQNGNTDKRPPAKKAPKEMDARHIAMKNFIEGK